MIGSKSAALPPAGLRWRNAEALREHLAGRLKELRARRGLTQAELADMSGVGERQIGKLERAEGGGSIETWFQLAEALDVPLEELFKGPASPAVAAREGADRYVGVPSHRRPASSREVDAVLLAVQRLDSKAVRALLVFARTMARRPPDARRSTKGD